MYIPGNVETKESISYLEKNFPELIFLDNNYYFFQEKINFFGLGGSLDHHGIVCDYEFPETYFTKAKQSIESKIQKLDKRDPLVFVFHEPPYFNMATKAKKRGYNYDFKNKAGSKDLYDLITTYDPKLVLNGHFHEYRGTNEVKNSVVINPGAMATYYYGILSMDMAQNKKYKMNFFRIQPSPFNFTNFLYQKRNFISNEVRIHS